MTSELAYAGSRLLQPLSDTIGLPIDQVNFMVCQLAALILSFVYRTRFGAANTGIFTRHVLQIVIGSFMAYFCFGRQVIHLLFQSIFCYALMKLLKPGIMEKLVFVVVMGYLCMCHIHRVLYDYGGYTLDITGPLMINTQRLTCLAFAIRDGSVKDEKKLTPFMKKHLVRRVPSILEFLSYVLCFHNLMCGPFSFYDDYIAFIDGSNYDTARYQEENSVKDGKPQHKDIPSPTGAVIRKLATMATCAAIFMILLPRYYVEYVVEAEFKQRSIFFKMFYIVFSTTLVRYRYYFAWKLGEAVNCMAGLGFNGYDKQGKAKWDLIDNANIVQVETCLSLKVLLDNWNITTSYWLRYVIYERLHNTLLVFIFSAFWHGFYAGYYVTFLTGALFIQAARLTRRKIRPYMQVNRTLAVLYDALTFTGSRVSLGYIAFPFVVLEFMPSWEVYKDMFFWMHIGGALLLLVVLVLPTPRSQAKVKEQ